MRLFAAAPVDLDDIRVFPDIARKSARIRTVVRNTTGHPIQGTLVLEIRGVGPADSQRRPPRSGRSRLKVRSW
jgi:hypothetical protein